MRMHLQTEIEIDATASEVWNVLADLDRYGEWNPFITGARGDLDVGATLTNRIEPPGGRAMTFRPTITQLEPGRVLEWLGRTGLPGLFDGRHRFELQPQPSGSTRLVHTEEFSGVLVRFMRRMIDTTTRAGFEAMNDALAVRVADIAQQSSV